MDIDVDARRSVGSGRVVLVLGRLDADLDDRFDDVRRAVDQELQLLALRAGEVAEHVVGRVLPARAGGRCRTAPVRTPWSTSNRRSTAGRCDHLRRRRS